MTNEMIELARRAVACPKWRWMPGMLASQGEGLRVVSVNAEHRYLHVHPGSFLLPAEGYTLPDLTDPATLGCLLALVREAHGQSTLSPLKRGTRSWCLAGYGTSALEGETEVELLVAALEGAP